MAWLWFGCDLNLSVSSIKGRNNHIQQPSQLITSYSILLVKLTLVLFNTDNTTLRTMIAILLLVPLAIAEAILRKRRQKKLRRANEQLQREARAQTRSQNRQRQTSRQGNTVPIQQGTGAPQYCDDTALPTYEEAVKQTQPVANKKAAKKAKKAKKQSPVVQRDNNLYVIQRQECSSRM